LPKDAKVSPAARGELAHPSYYTTAYTDAALGEFLAAMHRDDSWRDAVIVIASDHGNEVPPLNELYPDKRVRDIWLQSHVNLLLTGGMVDEALEAEHLKALSIDHLTSQADVAAFLSYVAGLKVRVMGENLFATHRTLPVVADLEEGVFDPVAGRLYPRRALTTAPPTTLQASERKTLLYYRAFLQFINSLHPTRGPH
jgi:arylsulfatase A-like enzyme